MKDTIIFVLLALEGICIISLSAKVEEKDSKSYGRGYDKGLADGINLMIRLYDTVGSQVCGLIGKIGDGVDVEIPEDKESSHDYN